MFGLEKKEAILFVLSSSHPKKFEQKQIKTEKQHIHVSDFGSHNIFVSKKF